MNQSVSLPVLGESGAGRLKLLLDERPLYLCVETTNICNARCVFCAYPKMQRPHAVMAVELFAKIVGDYVDMGGGAMALTPIVGDVLVDPHFIDRLRLLRRTRSITNVSFTTNGIAWGKFSDADQQFIVESCDCISFSIGGLDAASYERMFDVDRFEQVCRSIERICRIKSQNNLATEIHLLFRVNRSIDELLDDPAMDRFRRPEINAISGINQFGNWGGVIGESDLPPGAYLVKPEESPKRIMAVKKNPCFVHYLAPEITTAGLVSACGCMNAEAEALILGDVSRQHLGDIWKSEARRHLMATYGTESLPGICQRCSYYDDGERFITQPALRHFEIGENPWDVIRRNSTASPGSMVHEALTGMVSRGLRRVALYGAGNFTRTALRSKNLAAERFPLVAILDDNADIQGTRVADLPVISPGRAEELRIDGVVLSTDRYGDQMWDASQPLRTAGVEVVRMDGC